MDMSDLRKRYMKLAVKELRELAVYHEVSLPRKYVKSQLVDLILQKQMVTIYPPSAEPEDVPTMSVRVKRIFDAKKENRDI